MRTVKSVRRPSFLPGRLSEVSMVPLTPDRARDSLERPRHLPRQASRTERLPVERSVETWVVVPILVLRTAHGHKPTGGAAKHRIIGPTAFLVSFVC